MFKAQIKTFLLLAILTAVLISLGSLIGGRYGLFIGFALALVMNFGSYWWSDKIVLAMYRAKPASKSEYSSYHKMIEELCKKASIPKPKLFVIPLSISNAFATGRNPEHAAVAVTHGILHSLSNEELKGVLAHELSHIKNRDILIMSIAATIAGVISYVAFMARWAAIFGGFGGDREGGQNIIGLIAAAIVAPIAALLIQMAISRTREYSADAVGAGLLKSGMPLASALLKLEANAKAKPLAGKGAESTAHLFIVNPFRAGFFTSLFSTHPPVNERVKRLRELKF